MAEQNYFYALGRRKAATARVRLSSGKGSIVVNDKPAEEYFADSKYLIAKLQQPFGALEQENKYNITVRVTGGGHDGQVEAIRLGITKALVLLNGELKTPCMARIYLPAISKRALRGALFLFGG
jgi:small subunit ribosomal protein S9